MQKAEGFPKPAANGFPAMSCSLSRNAGRIKNWGHGIEDEDEEERRAGACKIFSKQIGCSYEFGNGSQRSPGIAARRTNRTVPQSLERHRQFPRTDTR